MFPGIQRYCFGLFRPNRPRSRREILSTDIQAFEKQTKPLSKSLRRSEPEGAIKNRLAPAFSAAGNRRKKHCTKTGLRSIRAITNYRQFIKTTFRIVLCLPKQNNFPGPKLSEPPAKLSESFKTLGKFNYYFLFWQVQTTPPHAAGEKTGE
jgi:hypothetical protein